MVLQAGLSPSKIPGFGDLQQRYTSSYAYYELVLYYAYSEIMCAYAYDEYYA